MKTLISIFAVTLALAFTGPAFAGAAAAKTEADCVKAGGTWDAATNTCAEKDVSLQFRLFHGYEGASASVGALSFMTLPASYSVPHRWLCVLRRYLMADGQQ